MQIEFSVVSFQLAGDRVPTDSHGTTQMAEKQRRSEMKPVTETGRQWAEALRAELEHWPAVRIRRSFGMTLIYRGELVFAALPWTRALHAEDAIMLKFQRETPALAKRIAADPHFVPGTLASTHKAQGEGRKWRFFLLRSDADVHAAIEWLAEAYRTARQPRQVR
jgi:hypothetical protein